MHQHDGWAELFRLLEFVEDPRDPRGVRHNLSETLFIIIGALLAGARHAEDIADWGWDHYEWLSQFGEYKHGTPSHDTVLNICAALKPETVESLVTCWVDYFLQSKGMSVAGNQVALDGKAQRGSRTTDGSSVQLVSAWLVEAGVVLRSEAIEKKSNEIVALPCLIKALDLRGATVTIDAMGCQRAIVEEIQAAGADYIVQVKGNQPGLQEECRAVAVEVSKPGRGMLDADKVELHREVDKGHGRVETRVCHLVRDLDLVTRREMWSGLSAIAVVSRERHEMATGKVSGDLALYLVSSETASAETIAQQIRAHWSIENSLHWCLDMTWGEDAHRARDRQGAANLGRLRRMAASMTKQAVGDGMSGRRVTGKCQRAPDHILRILRGEKISRPARRRPNRSKVGRFGQGTGKRNKANPTE